VSDSSDLAKDYFARGAEAIGRADYSAARVLLERSVELAPENVEAWCYLGIATTFREPEIAARALDRALAINANHLGSIYWRAEVYWLQDRPDEAARLFARMNELAPNAAQNLARMAYAYRAAGDEGLALEGFKAAVAAGDGLVSVDSRPDELRRAFYLDALGLRDDAFALVRHVCGRGMGADYPRERYPRELNEQRRALETVVAGRDLVLLGSGPSLGELEPLLLELGREACENLCFFGFNSVQVAERMIRDAIGRDIDVACMTVANVIEHNEAWLLRFLARADRPSVFCTLANALVAQGMAAGAAIERRERMFYFAASGDYPPIPDDPLHFPPINALLSVLPIAVLARPRNIFLFGCDGVVSIERERNAGVYYGQGSSAYGTRHADNHHYARWLARDTLFFNAMIPTVLASLSELHACPIAPIYNCNPNSAYRPFPRVNARDFLTLSRDAPMRE
jgi:tetratricopeptide (TPR) repeat protein